MPCHDVAVMWPYSPRGQIERPYDALRFVVYSRLIFLWQRGASLREVLRLVVVEMSLRTLVMLRDLRLMRQSSTYGRMSISFHVSHS